MRNHRKLLIMALSLILCITASVGIAFAYFTDYENARGGAILNLKGQTWIDEDADKDGKTIVIKNVNEPDMVVRVMIIADKDHLGDITPGNDWSGPDDDGWYYYGKVLKGSTDRDGDETSKLRAEVKVSGNEDINDFDVVVVQEAERVVYDQDSEGNNIVSVPAGWNIDSISAE